MLLCVAETLKCGPPVRITPCPVCMGVPPMQESRSVKSNQTVEGSVKKINKDLEHVSCESVVSTSTVESKISCHDKKVSIYLCMFQWQYENTSFWKLTCFKIWFEKCYIYVLVFMSNEIEILEPQLFHRIFCEEEFSSPDFRIIYNFHFKFLLTIKKKKCLSYFSLKRLFHISR